MDTGDQVTLPLDNPAFIVGTVTIIVICAFILALSHRFGRWAESRGLRWRWMGSNAFYLWPEDGRDHTRPSLAGALLALAAVLAVAGVLFILSTR